MPSYLSPGVYVEEVSSGSRPIEGVGTALCAFVGFTERGPLNEPILVTNWTQYTSNFGAFAEGAYLPHSVYGYFLNGGGAAYVVSVGTVGATGDTNGAPPALPAAVELTTGDENKRPGFTVRALADGQSGQDIAVEVADATEPGDENFKLVVTKGGEVAETFDNLSTKRGPANVVTVVRQQSKLIRVEEPKGSPLAVPRKGSRVPLAVDEPPRVPQVTPDQYAGDAAARTGFAGLETIEDVTMLCVPDAMAAHRAGVIDDEGLKAVQLAMIAHCELMGDRVAILDAPQGLNPQRMKAWRVDFAGYDSKYATLYYPWIKVMDPLSGRPEFIPPSGHMAGVWARTDATRGVHKAPANEVVRGVISLESGMTRGEHDQLNPVGVNCIRSFPGQGIRVWGARTLSSDPEWRYLNVRRLFNFVEKSILLGTNWVVFEPNDRYLWERVQRTISTFLRRVWRSGALFGGSPEQAYYVKCDAENNPPENIDVGILTVDIGLSPVKPAEFVVFRVSQLAQGAELAE
jgi:hypothetical protein